MTVSLVAQIPDTCLLKVCIGNGSVELDKALKENHWNKRITPYYVAMLSYFLHDDKKKFYDNQNNKIKNPALKEHKKKEEMLDAGVIFMKLEEEGLAEIQNEILSYLPTVTPMLAQQYQLLAKQKAAKRKESQSNQNMPRNF